jgi:hypothetical protein
MLSGGAFASPARAKSPARNAAYGLGRTPPGTPHSLRPPPAWAVSPGRQWSVSPGRAETVRRAAAHAAAKERAEQRWRDRLRRVLGGASSAAAGAVRVATAAVHGVGACNVFLLYLVAEPLFIPIVASSVSMLTCNHLDVHRPFPHLARDDTLRCYGPDHLPLMAMGAAVALATPLLATWFLTRVAPKQDLSVRELPHFAVARVGARWGCTRSIQLTYGLKAPGFNPWSLYSDLLVSQNLLPNSTCTVTPRWFAASFSIAQGEVELTRDEPRGSYGVPSGAHDGWASTDHLMLDLGHLMLLMCACFALYAGNFRYQPVRGKCASINASRGAAYACASWAAMMGWKVTCLSAAPPGGGTVSQATEIGDAVVFVVMLPVFFYVGWRHTAQRGELFSFPDESPHKMRRHDDPRVRAMGVLCGNASDGLVGAFGHWEGLDRQRDNEEMDAEMAADHIMIASATAVNQTPVGLCKLNAVDPSLKAPALNRSSLRSENLVSKFASKCNLHCYTLGEGLEGLTQEAQDDVAEDSLTWQIVLQTHFAGFGVGLNVRVHACRAVAALARSERGVMCVQRACLVPLLKVGLYKLNAVDP